MCASFPEAGVDSIKIEGRAKGAYYVASAVNAYRHVLDGEPADAWQAELETTSHRPYSTGFYFGAPGQNQGVKEYARDYQMVARVVSCGKNAPSLAAGGQVDASSPATGEAAGNVSRPFPQADVADRAGCARLLTLPEIQPWPEAGIAARRQAIASDPYAEKKGCVSLFRLSMSWPHRPRRHIGRS